MGLASDGPLSPNRQYYELRGRAAEISRALGSQVAEAGHLFLAMIRSRETVPARALAGLADLDALDAAVLEARNAPTAGPPADAVFRRRGTGRFAATHQRRAARLHHVRLPYRRG